MSRPVPDEVLLGLIKSQPSHGYDLLEVFRSNKHLGRIWHLSTSQLYAVLKRLEEKGSIRGVDIEVKDAPSKREYRILPAGEEELNRWLFEPKPSASLHRIRVLFLSRVYIASVLNWPVEEIIQNQIAACEAQRYAFESEQRNTDSDIEALALDFVISQLNCAIKWLNNCKNSQTID